MQGRAFPSKTAFNSCMAPLFLEWISPNFTLLFRFHLHDDLLTVSSLMVYGFRKPNGLIERHDFLHLGLTRKSKFLFQHWDLYAILIHSLSDFHWYPTVWSRDMPFFLELNIYIYILDPLKIENFIESSNSPIYIPSWSFRQKSFDDVWILKIWQSDIKLWILSQIN